MTATVQSKPVSGFGEFLNSRPMRRFRRNPLAIAGLTLVIMFALVAFFAPLLAPPKDNCIRDLGIKTGQEVYNPTNKAFWESIFWAPSTCYQITRLNFSAIPTPPGEISLLGTSEGYDIWYGLVWGTRTMFRLGLIVVALTLFAGTVIGAVSGFYGGWIDNIIQRFIDVLFAFPSLVLTMVLVTILQPSLSTLIFAFSVTGWVSYARLLRGEILRVKRLEYVDAARALGATDFRLIFQHVLPNSLTAMMVIAVLDLGAIPISAAGMSFLGLGLPVGYTDWGQLMAFARPQLNVPSSWYVSFFPAITIVLFGLGWNLLGDALRDAFDPKSK